MLYRKKLNDGPKAKAPSRSTIIMKYAYIATTLDPDVHKVETMMKIQKEGC